MIELTDETLSRIETLFPQDRDEVERLLREECADNLPLWVETTPEGLERIRFAVLKLSNGDITALREHIRIAQIDWRDVLVAAGFGHDPRAHEAWAP